jgi:hypothetical protein
MRRGTEAVFAAVAVLAASAVACAGDSARDAQGLPPKLSVDQRAITACIAALISRMHPSGDSQVRAVIASPYMRVFSNLDAGDRESAKVMELKMTAYRAGTKELLVKAACTVDNSAIVLDLSMTVLNPAGLEQLTLSDLKLTVVGG